MSLNGTLKALSDPIRRNILTMLKGKKMIAGDIAEELGIYLHRFHITSIC